MTTTRRVGSYMSAIHWIAANDDTEWLTDEHRHPSVTLCLVADIFGRSADEATADLRKLVERDRKAQHGLEQARAFARSVLNNIDAAQPQEVKP